jgi:hypothetical protein
MLMLLEEKATTTRGSQLVFDFISPDEAPPPRKKREPRAKSVKAPPAPSATDHGEAQHAISDVCRLLHELARKFIPKTEFSDYAALVRCTQVLLEHGAIQSAPVELNAAIAEHDAALVIHAAQYRRLRTRSIAGLATVADLLFKAPAKGSPDYQKGMRDAYRHAGEVAAVFLEDVQNGV